MVKLPEIDQRNKEDIKAYMKKQLSTYTPEWRFDEDNPDVGTALAMIYAEMMGDTIYRFNQVPERTKLTFFNKLGANLAPAVPAYGYITFSLVNSEVDGVEVSRGTQVLANASADETVVFETQNDVYVTPAEPDCMFLSAGENDYMGMVFDKEQKNSLEQEIALFDFRKVNLQKHQIYLSHPSILQIKKEAWVYCSFVFSGKIDKLTKEQVEAFLDTENVIFEYYSVQGYVEFSERKEVNGQLAFLKQESQPAFAEDEDGNYWIRCTVKDVTPFENFQIHAMGLRSSGREIVPDEVNVQGIDQKINEFFPFSERPSLYDEMYLVSGEVLGKKGSCITIDFDLEYAKFPLEVEEVEREINWKAIMKRSDIKVDVDYDISIAEVIWEYYNGEGFSRLYRNNQYADIFGIQDGAMAKRVSMRFECPDDIEPFLVNSTNTYCIRARVLKMNNLYKMKGNYITPFISNPRLRYEYIQDILSPETLIIQNNMESRKFTDYSLGGNQKKMVLFPRNQDKVPTLYLGFDKPPVSGPIKMLFSMRETMFEQMPVLQYEYFSKNRWNHLSVVDETEQFRKTGIVTMIGNSDFKKCTLFGKEKYWIRILDVNQRYSVKNKEKKTPILNGIYMNSTQITATETMEPEMFHILPNQESKVCQLKNGKVHQIEVWVNEFTTIHLSEIKEMEKEYPVQYEYNDSGELIAVWVQWKETESFDLNYSEKRWYQVNRIDGVVTFPNGRNGKIPTSTEEPTILIQYNSGGGTSGNLSTHKIQNINKKIGFINEVTNYEITTGGCDQEQIQEVVRRNEVALRHGYRAVTICDYEDLAFEASRNVRKVKCFPNRNGFGERMNGYVTLVVLQKDYENGRKYFDAVRNQIFDYIKDRMSSNIYEQNRFYITEPQFMELHVTVRLQVAEYNEIFDVRKQVEKRIQDFLNPVTGNFKNTGWEIGEIPNITQISNAIRDIPKICMIEKVSMAAYGIQINGTIEIDLDKIDSYPFCLPLNGKHEIVISVKEE